MKGDRERCLAVGMDGYVSKPLSSEDLFRVMAEVLPGAKQAQPAPPASEAPPPEKVFDEARALARVAGDEEGLRQAAERFLERSPKECAAIRTAATAGDCPTMAKLAHKFKGLLSIFSERAAAAAGELEQAGRDGDAGPLDERCSRLERSLEELTQALRAWLDRYSTLPGSQAPWKP
jgi:HPt (histidine-containing phosphotransfer) domain-containing protein